MATDLGTLTRGACGAFALLAVYTAAPGQQPRPARPAAQARDVITPGMIALGDSVFHGKVAAAVCFGCHGADAKGTPGVGADLTTGRWLHGDGSYAFILRIIETGVPQPKVAKVGMPPMGGPPLGPAELHAVAAYVFSLSHPRAPTRP